MIKFKNIDHVVLRVRDLDTMMLFYVDTLGLNVEKIQADIGLYQLRAGDALIDLVPVDSKLGKMGGPAPNDTGHNMDHFCLGLADTDVDTARSLLMQKGIEVGPVQRRYGAGGNGPSIYLKDPEGNTLELKESSNESI